MLTKHISQIPKQSSAFVQLNENLNNCNYKKKPIVQWKLNAAFRKNLKSLTCARSMDYIFCGGVVDWYEWCTCKNERAKMNVENFENMND